MELPPNDGQLCLGLWHRAHTVADAASTPALLQTDAHLDQLRLMHLQAARDGFVIVTRGRVPVVWVPPTKTRRKE